MLKHSHKIVWIPRIFLKPKEGDFPFEWSRRQLTVSVAFAITINKSEGQTLKQAGVFLQEPVFAHGQLYVAASRVSHPQNIRFALTPEQSPSWPLHYRTRNIVYKEVLR
jgi:ATP-dependent DNA helicase PIF1